MTEMLLFHHAQGQTTGFHAFANTLRNAGHTVHTPDLFEGHTFETLEAGVAYAKTVGFKNLLEQGLRSADTLPTTLVYAGFSLGVMPAQQLAQTRPGALGALFFEACLPTSEFGNAWPKNLPVQIHGMDADPFFATEGDLEAAQALVEEAHPWAEIFLYPGNQHLFADNTLASYDHQAANLLTQRVLAFLERIGASS